MAKLNLEQIVAKTRKKYGDKAAYVGNSELPVDVVPTGVLALDYALGIGGWPRGHFVEVFGAPNIGKTSVMGYSAIAQAQKLGLNCAIINVEPRFDKGWVARRGVDVDELPVFFPDSGEQAFEMLREFCMDPDIPLDFILFDSIGALSTESDLQPEAKSRVGGQSKLITDGIKRCVMAAWKNNVGVMMINQQRDDHNARIAGLVESPGGWALKHAMMYRIHLKPGRERYTAKIDGDDRLIGRELVANIKKSAAGESLGATARFDFYHVETDDAPFGVDTTQDVINTGVKTKVIEQAGAWYRHPAFGEKGQLMGKKAVDAFIADNPQVVEVIRNDVMKVMERKRSEAQAVKPQLEAVDG
jgi:recombination protein RecA